MTGELLSAAVLVLPAAWIKARKDRRTLLSLIGECGKAFVFLGVAWTAVFRGLEMLPGIVKAEFDELWERHKKC